MYCLCQPPAAPPRLEVTARSSPGHSRPSLSPPVCTAWGEQGRDSLGPAAPPEPLWSPDSCAAGLCSALLSPAGGSGGGRAAPALLREAEGDVVGWLVGAVLQCITLMLSSHLLPAGCQEAVPPVQHHHIPRRPSAHLLMKDAAGGRLSAQLSAPTGRGTTRKKGKRNKQTNKKTF